MFMYIKRDKVLHYITNWVGVFVFLVIYGICLETTLQCPNGINIRKLSETETEK